MYNISFEEHSSLKLYTTKPSLPFNYSVYDAFNYSQIVFIDTELVFNGIEYAFNGSELAFNGIEYAFNGSELAFNATEWVNIGGELAFNATEWVFNATEGVISGMYVLNRKMKISNMLYILRE